MNATFWQAMKLQPFFNVKTIFLGYFFLKQVFSNLL